MTAQDGITVALALVIRNAGPLPVIRNEKLPALVMRHAVALILVLKRAVALLLIMKLAVALLLIMKRTATLTQRAVPPNLRRNNASGNE